MDYFFFFLFKEKKIRERVSDVYLYREEMDSEKGSTPKISEPRYQSTLEENSMYYKCKINSV